MTQKVKDLLHSIVITISAIIAVIATVVGAVYLAITSSGTAASIFASVVWCLIFAGASALFIWGAYTCWKEWKYWYIDKKEE